MTNIPFFSMFIMFFGLHPLLPSSQTQDTMSFRLNVMNMPKSVCSSCFSFPSPFLHAKHENASDMGHIFVSGCLPSHQHAHLGTLAVSCTPPWPDTKTHPILDTFSCLLHSFPPMCPFGHIGGVLHPNHSSETQK